jgi:hypothetical protein
MDDGVEQDRPLADQALCLHQRPPFGISQTRSYEVKMRLIQLRSGGRIKTLEANSRRPGFLICT